ncbi:MAG: hypothetical protein HYT80_06855 [Euryarchaeota archaeon]|nr:hypothetical protein [Euryarchaeota archaeon]
MCASHGCCPGADRAVIEPGTIYLRAHAIYQGEHFWSDETSVVVEIGKGAVMTITYQQGAVTGASARPPTYAPGSSIKRGDGIKLTNSDAVGHNLVCNSGTPEPCSIGTTASGTTSAAVYLTKAGTYAFSCTLHTSMANFGSFTVTNELN